MSQPHKKFAKLRQWNRRRNYYLKSLRMRIAKLLWDYRYRAPFDLENIKKVLLLRDDGKIGDMVISTSLFREFHSRGLVMDVLATPENIIIIENNPYIRKIYVNNSDDLTDRLFKEEYDAVIDMGDKISPASLKFLRKIKPKNVIGFNKESYNIYNKNIHFDGYDKHISTRYALLLDALKFKDYSVDYDLHIPESIHLQVSSYLQALPGKYNIILNPFTASNKRDLSSKQIQDLVNQLHEQYNHINIFIIGLPERIKDISAQNIYIYPNLNIYSAMSLIAHADLIISPDTSVVHIAAAWKKPLVALYGNDKHGKFKNNDVWGPGYPGAIQITTRDEYHSISTISIPEILQAVDTIFMKEA